MNWIDYRESLGLSFNDRDKSEYFINNIFNILEVIMEYDWEEYFHFCMTLGISASLYGRVDYDSYAIDFSKNVLLILRGHNIELSDFLSTLIACVNCKKDKESSKYKKKDYIHFITRELNRASIQHEVIEDNDGYFIFPKGVEEFDLELVSKPLTWLSGYPEAEKAWKKALKSYSNATSSNASDVADLFRKALESFFKSFFKTDSSLENCKSLYGTYLKERGITKDISNNLTTLLQMYTNYNNQNAKHNDAADVCVLEYIMYQTGNTIRLLITLNHKEKG